MEEKIRFVVYSDRFPLSGYEWVYERSFGSLSSANDFIVKEKLKEPNVKLKVIKESTKICFII